MSRAIPSTKQWRVRPKRISVFVGRGSGIEVLRHTECAYYYKGSKIVAKRLYRRDVRRVVKRHVRDVSRADVVKAYRNSRLKNLHGEFLDRRYRALPMRVWELILEYSQVDKKQYRSDHWDCDNFALALCGQVPMWFDVNGVGFVVDFSGGHAYNAILVSESQGHLEVVGVEPQNDRWGVAKTGVRMYSAQNGYTIFS